MYNNNSVQQQQCAPLCSDDNAMQLFVVKVIFYVVHVHLLLKFVMFPMPFFCVV